MTKAMKAPGSHQGFRAVTHDRAGSRTPVDRFPVFAPDGTDCASPAPVWD